MIALPRQDLDLDRLEAFTDELGGRDVTPFITPVEGRPHVLRVIKEPSDELNFANAWHTDLSYLTAPPAYTVLHAHDVPPAGGDTMWANQYLAYESLPDSVKHQIADLRATHSAGMAYGTGGYLEAVAGKSSMTVAPSPDAYAVETHPLVIRHPRTGRPALVCQLGVHHRDRGHGPRRGAGAARPADRARDASELHVPAALGAADADDLGQQRHAALRDQRLPRRASRDVPHQRRRHRAAARLSTPRIDLCPCRPAGRDTGCTDPVADRSRCVRPLASAVEGDPEFGAQPIGGRRSQPVGHDDAFDHVGDDGTSRTPFRRIDTTAPSGRRRIDRSTPTSRGGHRKLGPTSPRRRASRVRVRAAAANSTVVADSIRQP